MMNRSKSDTPRQGDRASSAPAAPLTETATSRVEEARGSLLRAPRPDDAGRLARSSQISEILDRQKLLSRNRPPPPAAANLSLADQIRERLRSPAAPASAAISAPRSSDLRPSEYRASDYRQSEYRQPSAEHAAIDISEALAKLRHDLKQDLAASFAQEIASLRNEVKEIGASVAENGYPQDLYADLQRLAEGMEYIGEATENAVTNSMRSELDSIRAMVNGMARQDDLAVIIEHFDALRQEMAEADKRSQTQSLDVKIGSLADAIEMLVAQMSNADRDMNSQMHTLDERLADVVAAIEANAQATAELSSGDAGFGSLEARIAQLIQEIDAVNLPAHDNIVAERIEGLAARMEELAKLQATEHLDRRFDELAALLAQGGATPAGEDLTAIVSDISRKIDDMARGTVSSDLVNRFDDLVNRIDNLDGIGASGGLSEEILTWLEERMNDIAARIDGNVAAKGNPAADLGALEEQIAALTKLLSEPRVAEDINTAQMTSRMSALEDYMSTNDEYIVEAARQAAETALEAYVRNFAGQPSSTSMPQADISTISDLASDLHALEALTRSGEARNQQTFETLQQTLMQIADRLDKLGASTEAAAAPAASKAAAAVSSRPRLRTGTDTEMFSSDFDDDLFDDDFSIDNTTTRDGGEKPLKGFLSSIGNRFRKNGQDQKAEEPRRTLDAAPAIDAADDISPDLANQLLEPGSGAPDIRQILEKVRAVQDGKPVKKDGLTAREDDNSDYIAVARRAAQAAAAEVRPIERNDDEAEASVSVIGKYRRPLLLGTGLVLLAVMSWPLANTMFSSPNAPQAQPAAVTQPTPSADAAADEKAAAEKLAADKAAADQALADKAAADAKAEAPAASDVTAPPANAAAATPAATVSEPAAAPQAAKPEASASTAAAPAQTAPADTAAPATEVKPETQAAATVTPPASAAPAATTPAAGALAVPTGIEPQALVDAANGGDALAIYEIGNRIFDGRGVAANPAMSVAWYTKAASLGFAPAEYRLGSLYEKGVGVGIDPAKAVEHYTTAAKAGNISAMHNLAVLYATGSLGSQDFTSAGKWFTEAANHGVRDSQFNLAILYAKGSGVTQDLVQSYKWFGIAAKDGDVDAAQKRDEVGKVLSADQLTKAKAEVDGWKPATTDDKANATILPDAWAGKAQKTNSVDMKKAITYIQAMLNKNGFDVGRPDGVMGGKTVAAIKQFQSSVGQQPTGEINDALVKELIARSK
ncbi:SEL1-like repeat protein [Rhizobium sp. C4]|uniref:SEL1-like repeat protein n=1 Tax=Rhizobium sp. C4 TaxID=1349800 RepID=UPI001E386B45|nr:SEL1-like repeat protein [Rhizobium sp. C4]MCD2174607.1 peptidoglycan-binding protein [Rhizobium sp. C4]